MKESHLVLALATCAVARVCKARTHARKYILLSSDRIKVKFCERVCMYATSITQKQLKFFECY